MKTRILFICLVVIVAPAFGVAAATAPSCWFLKDSAAVAQPAQLKSILVDNYFRLFYPPQDKFFAASNASGDPILLARYESLFERSHHFLQTELGWRMPVTTTDINRPELHVYFVSAPHQISGTTRMQDGPVIYMNSESLLSKDFSALWIHQLAHAAEMQYKPAGDWWFYEATAGWMEGQFDRYSRSTQKAVLERMAHPEISILDPDPVLALGNLRLLELLARPYRDVLRQIWERWSQPTSESLVKVIDEVLSLNHLPEFQSYLQNYFLLFNASAVFDADSADVSIRPYAAYIVERGAENSSGGVRLLFTPAISSTYSASLLYVASGEKSGTLAMRTGLRDNWSILVPFAGLDHYKLILVNASATEVQGTLTKAFDASIPAVVQYFRVNAGDGGVQIEWKTAKENGVAFWNLYKIRNGQKQLLNAFPIPASITSEQGVQYLFVDSSASAFYSLEAITSDGFQSTLAGSDKHK